MRFVYIIPACVCLLVFILNRKSSKELVKAHALYIHFVYKHTCIHTNRISINKAIARFSNMASVLLETGTTYPS
jgi:hypothetical protein